MRNRGPSKQRLWLGTGRHFRGGGRRRDADANAHCYSDSDCHANRQCHCYSDGDRHANVQPYCNSIGNCHAATDANTQSGAISKAAPNPSAEAIEFRRADSFL
jgi:hypothetical protein